jgi:hypothetical protein
MSWIKKLKWNEAFHGCPMLQVGATGINQPTNILAESAAVIKDRRAYHPGEDG